ncbi:hypothetical protein PPL_03217 [Heterostelium album PN500]|uniref:Endoglucanase n=1 Tax=Heterostelium pallidum (strain ATCC 26659 / Pp 5 / PN500) TaxID=670386 RepID=D3B495_HETP5|nr:hypothetical protein PPL_03217 [Heterostelium album PN500]EFA84143.1 hypothetical protein PPL_03217 [Heterostelium album PN500]|eukprot:XP_020436260.1 hypothetical protein PPL_03217 [Heterostelium album PN500]
MNIICKLFFILCTILVLLKPMLAYDYCEYLHYSLFFYKYNRAGKLPDNDVPWRGDSTLNDGGGVLSAGYFDAGDHVKFGFPLSSTLTMLSWGFIQYQPNIEKCNSTKLYQDTIRYGTDWLIAAHQSDNKIAGQVGDPNADHAYWGPPETMTMDRPTYYLDTTKPGTELAMEAAAALAAASIVFKTSDPTYSATCLEHARQLHSFGDNYRGTYSDNIPNVSQFYKSWSGFDDEIVWGSIWLFKATGDSKYLEKAEKDYNDFQIVKLAKQNSHDWDLKSPGAALLLSQLSTSNNNSVYIQDVEEYLNWWLPGGGVPYTPGGLAWIRQWGPCRYSATTAFLMSIYGKNDDKYIEFTKKQIAYILGDNPKQQSFVVGMGPNAPINAHHRAAHHSTTNNIMVPVNNTYLLKGALVGGPSQDDSWKDDRTDYIRNEVALDYNSGFVGAIAYLAGTV